MSRSSAHDASFRLAPLRQEDVVFRPNLRARRYVARVDKAGNFVLTVPRGGNRRDALSFANGHRDWLEEQKTKVWDAIAAESSRRLDFGDEIFYRGRRCRLRLERSWGRPVLAFSDQRVMIADEGMNLAKPLAEHLRKVAKVELPARVFELAAERGLKVAKVVIRDQKTRWGSCSVNRHISLNWRLLLVPLASRDYVILHELMHLRRFDHSPAFWRLVEQACPDFRKHERWLEVHQDELKW